MIDLDRLMRDLWDGETERARIRNERAREAYAADQASRLPDPPLERDDDVLLVCGCREIDVAKYRDDVAAMYRNTRGLLCGLCGLTMRRVTRGGWRGAWSELLGGKP